MIKKELEERNKYEREQRQSLETSFEIESRNREEERRKHMKIDYEVRQLQKENLKLEKKNQALEIKILDNEKVFRTEVMKTTDKENQNYNELKNVSDNQIKEL